MKEVQDAAEYSVVDDLLAKHFGPSPPPMSVKFGAMTHVGRVRTNNEDHYLVLERRRTRAALLTNLPEGMLSHADDIGYILAVADGMGGPAFGELASMLALRSGWEQAPNTIKWTWIITDREIDELKERVELVFQRIHQALLERARVEPALEGMGTTLTGAYTVGPEAFIGHVGDSRAYLYHDGKLTQLTRDHTLAQQCLDAGMPVPCRSWYHKLTHCLGVSEEALRVEFHHFHLADGDRLLLCTDGLTDMVRDEEIAAILSQDIHPQETVRALVDLALEHGGKDNVTVILAGYELKEPDRNCENTLGN
jgi:protein phosphatase